MYLAEYSRQVVICSRNITETGRFRRRGFTEEQIDKQFSKQEELQDNTHPEVHSV